MLVSSLKCSKTPVYLLRHPVKPLDRPLRKTACFVSVTCRLEIGDKFTSSLSDSGELVLLIQEFSLTDVGEYKVVVENELGSVSQIIRMEMSGAYNQFILLLHSFLLIRPFIHSIIKKKFQCKIVCNGHTVYITQQYQQTSKKVLLLLYHMIHIAGMSTCS